MALRYGKTWSARWIVLCLLAALALAACGDDDDGGGNGGGEGGGNGASSQPKDITLTTVPSEGNSPLFIAKEEGFYEDVGLTAEVDTVRFSPDVVAATVGGNVDFGSVNPVTILQALSKNVPIKVLAPIYYSTNPIEGYYVAKDSDIQDYGDLEGARIGTIGRGNTTEVAISKLAQDAGVDISTLEFLEIPLPNMAEAIRSGQIDVGHLIEPFVTIEEDTVRLIGRGLEEAYGPEGLVSAMIVSENLIDEDPDMVASFMEAFTRAQQHAAENPDAVREVLPTYTELEPDLIDQIELSDYPESWDAEELTGKLEKFAEIMVETGQLESPPDLSDAVYEP
jgi:NitT/TauT family transport system substrate-binding protein